MCGAITVVTAALLNCRYPVEVSRTLPYSTIKSSMMAARRNVQPPLPQTMTDLFNYFNEPDVRSRFGSTMSGSQFYRMGVRDEDGGMNLIFISENMEQLLLESTVWSMDGTFKTRPASPPMRQLFFIMCFRYDHAFPAVAVLMENKSYSAYNTIFCTVKRLFPLIAPSTIITDFEHGLQNAVNNQFPSANIVGCLFHSTQSMVRRSVGLGLRPFQTDNPDGPIAKSVRLCMALPCLPPERIEEALSEIISYAMRHNVFTEMESFFQYMERQWIRGVQARHLSVWGQVRRTNNDHESFNHMLGQMIQHHGSLWSFLDRLRTVEDVYHRKLHSAQNSFAIARNPPRKYLLLNQNIKRAQKKLIEGRISSFEYIEYIANIMRTTHASGLRMEDNVEEEFLAPPPESNQNPGNDSLDSDDSSDDNSGNDEIPARPDTSRGRRRVRRGREALDIIRGRGRGTRGVFSGRGRRARGGLSNRRASRRGVARSSPTANSNFSPPEISTLQPGPVPSLERSAAPSSNLNVENPSSEEMDLEVMNRRLRCDICLLNPRNVLNMPCRHLVSCLRCAEAVLASSHPWCGVCRQRFSIVELFWT